MTKKSLLPYLLISAFAVFLFLPIFFAPELVIGRNNDLSEFFGAILQFIKTQILENKQLPLWNNLFLAGTPLLPDPQSQLFYLPNIIFLILPIGTGFLFSFFTHLVWAGVGTYLSAKRLFKSSPSTYLAAFIYMSSALFWGSLQAGHFGLFNAYVWLPWTLLGLISSSPILTGISLAMIFFSHPIIFFLSTGLIILLSLGLKPLRVAALKGILLSVGLTAISLIPQLKWIPLTTRNLLTQNPDVYPKWHSVFEFVKAVIVPNLQDEKRLFIGVGALLLMAFGFWKLEKKAKMIFVAALAGTVLVALNNASPLADILLRQKTFTLLRVSTRVWFFVPLLASLLAAYGFESMAKTRKRAYLKYLIFLIVILETVFVFWKGILSETKNRNYAPSAVYEFLTKDKDLFRVFCTTRCLSQKDAARANLQLLDGYATLIQTNFYHHSWELTNSYWNYYSLSVPPVGTYEFEKLQPKASSLAPYNVRYVVSLHELTDTRFRLMENIDGYMIYENTINLPRAYFLGENLNPEGEAGIILYSPNLIKVATDGKPSNRLVLAEVFSPGWKAYLNGKEERAIQETPNALRYVELEETTRSVEFRYDPPGYKTGKILALITVLLSTLWIFLNYAETKKILGRK